jgi:hypothetical protein
LEVVMRATRMVRTLAVLASVSLVFAAMAAPAEAKKKKKKKLVCDEYVSAVEGAEEAEVVQITDAATEEAPVVIEFEHGGALPEVATESLYFNVQIYSKATETGLHILDEFDDREDVDLYLYDAAGEEVDSAAGFNPAPEILGDNEGRTGTNFEHIPGFAATQCAGYTIESLAYLTDGTPATLSIWLGEAAPPPEE